MSTPDSTSSSLRTLPWATGLAALVAIALFLLPEVAAGLVYDRSRVLQGEWWRALTAHWVHFSAGHLGWNLAVLVPAGVWAERIQPVRARVLYVVGPVLIGAAMFWMEPNLARYGGLSGLAAGILAFLALAQLRAGATDRWFWRAVLALLALKIIAEVVVASPLFAHFPDPSVRSVPLSHLAGVVAAIFSLNVHRRRHNAA